MSTLTDAILDGNVNVVRQLLHDEPALLDVPSKAGTMPLELAKNKGIVEIVAALTLSRQETTPNKKDSASLLISLLRELSHNMTCAGWYNNIEYYIWHAVKDKAFHVDDSFFLYDINNGLRMNLIRLSELACGWPSWNNIEGKEIIIHIDSWLDMYESWKRSLPPCNNTNNPRIG